MGSEGGRRRRMHVIKGGVEGLGDARRRGGRLLKGRGHGPWGCGPGGHRKLAIERAFAFSAERRCKRNRNASRPFSSISKSRLAPHYFSTTHNTKPPSTCAPVANHLWHARNTHARLYKSGIPSTRASSSTLWGFSLKRKFPFQKQILLLLPLAKRGGRACA